MFTRRKTGGFTAFLWKTPRRRVSRRYAPQEPRARPGQPDATGRPNAPQWRSDAAREPVSSDPDPDSLHSHHPVPTGPPPSIDEGRTYSLMRRSCDGGIPGGDGSMTSPPVTVR